MEWIGKVRFDVGATAWVVENPSDGAELFVEGSIPAEFDGQRVRISGRIRQRGESQYLMLDGMEPCDGTKSIAYESVKSSFGIARSAMLVDFGIPANVKPDFFSGVLGRNEQCEYILASGEAEYPIAATGLESAIGDVIQFQGFWVLTSDGPVVAGPHSRVGEASGEGSDVTTARFEKPFILRHVAVKPNEIAVKAEGLLQDGEVSLDALALLCGTDKSSAFHNYTDVYEEVTKGIRHKVKNVVEFGVARGSSTLMWSKWFQNAHIYGFDLHKVVPWGERITHFQMNCTHPLTSELVRSIRPDIIVDDASHTNASHQITFELAFDGLKPGGLYIIEDLHTSYYPEFGGSPTHLGEPVVPEIVDELRGKWGRTMDWLSELAHLVHISLYSKDQKQKIFEKYPWAYDIASVSFHYGLVIIKKRTRG